MIISINVAKVFDIIQHSFMIRKSQKSGYRCNTPQKNKGHI